jgi:flagellar basal body-associated protein FliL
MEKSTKVILFSVLALAVLGTGGYLIYRSTKKKEEEILDEPIAEKKGIVNLLRNLGSKSKSNSLNTEKPKQNISDYLKSATKSVTTKKIPTNNILSKNYVSKDLQAKTSELPFYQKPNLTSNKIGLKS